MLPPASERCAARDEPSEAIACVTMGYVADAMTLRRHVPCLGREP